MYSDPFRLRVQKAISALFDTISPANGYVTDLSPNGTFPTKNFRGRMVYGENDPLPMTSILEAPLQPDQLPSPAASDASTGGWELVIQGFVQDDPVNPTDPAHVLLADVKKALYSEKIKENEGTCLGIREIETLHIGPGVVRPPDQVSSQAYFWLTLTVDMVETLADPYA